MARKPDNAGDDRGSPDAVAGSSGAKKAEPLKSPLSQAIEALRNKDDDAFKTVATKEVKRLIETQPLNNYAVYLLFDEATSIANHHADTIYAATAVQSENPKDVLLVLQSNGGSIEPAYLISKTLKRLAKSRFVVAVLSQSKIRCHLDCSWCRRNSHGNDESAGTD